MLKQQILSDFQNIFLNINEFARDRDINGVTVRCVVDDSRTIPLKMGNGPYEGVYTGAKTLFVKEEDLGYRPVTNQQMHIDGVLHFVQDCWESFGILQVVLEASMS